MNFKQKKNALKNENIGWMQQPNTNKQHETCHKIKKENLQLKLILFKLQTISTIHMKASHIDPVD
ncbi:hypothetical protein DERP_010499 [Dermatophagoides pteronyssinus]|uniref:Uncharacterized protein n=1 Tax=Dermatophagoides pteronyssinus TaxID=6956 RepID=A0ABQ8JG10_DERPT|nr:hypothetical protein DERP_010499 [Dermatophagoides pteronyssinus]